MAMGNIEKNSQGAPEFIRCTIGPVSIDRVRLENGEAWVTQAQIAQLYEIDKSGVGRHVADILKVKELQAASCVAKLATQLRGENDSIRNVEVTAQTARVGGRPMTRRAPGHASIEEHPKGSGRFRVRPRIDGKLKVVASGLPRAEAEEVAAAYTEIRQEAVLREGVTLTQFGVGFLNRRERNGVRGIDQERNRWSAYVDNNPLGNLPVSTLRRRDIVDWVDELMTGTDAA